MIHHAHQRQNLRRLASESWRLTGADAYRAFIFFLLVLPLVSSPLSIIPSAGAAQPATPNANRTVSGFALWFDGSDDFLKTNRWFSTAPDGYCLEMWVKPAPTSPYSPRASLLTHRGPRHITFLRYEWRTHRFTFTGGRPTGNPLSLNTARKITTGGWHHVAVSADGSQAVLYVDGSAISQVARPPMPDWHTAHLGSFLGGDPIRRPIAMGSLCGQIDEIRIWAKARTADDIRANMNRPVAPDAAGLAGYWNFDEGKGQVARDVTGKGLDAQLGATPNADAQDPLWIRSDCPVAGLDKPGPAGHSIWLDGQNDRLRFGPLVGLRGAKSLTLEAWIRPSDSPAGSLRIETEGSPAAGDLQLQLGGKGQLSGQVASVAFNHANALKPAAWQHLAVVVDPQSLAVLIDGRSVKTFARQGAASLAGQSLSFISEGGFACDLDELRVWNVARTAEQVRAAMGRTISPAEPALVGYWRFDDGVGQIVRDWSAASNHGWLGARALPGGDDPLWLVSNAPIAQNDPTTTGGASRPDRNGALAFDGRDDRVDVGNAPELWLTEAVTVEAWIKPIQVMGQRPVIAKANNTGRQNSFEMQILNGRLRFQVADGTVGCCGDQGWTTVQGRTPIQSGTWHHVAGVFDRKQLAVYLDGVLDGRIAFSKPMLNIPYPVRVGSNGAARPRFFHGEIDEVRLWSRARSEEQILMGMNVVLRGNEPGLVGYWTFDDPQPAPISRQSAAAANRKTTGGSSQSQVAFDHSPLENHGVLGGSMIQDAKDPRWVPSGAPVVSAERKQ